MSSNKKKIRCSVVGVKGQAGRLINILSKLESIELSKVYYHKANIDKQLPITDNFNDLLTSDCIFVASPTHTHRDYLERLLNYPGYIFLEKPAVSNKQESEWLEHLPEDFLKRIKVNYNFRHSTLAQKMKSFVNSVEFGEAVYLSIIKSHGLAHKTEYQKNWRANKDKSFGVFELVGVHFIDFCCYLFGEPKQFSSFATTKASSKGQGTPDSVSLAMIMQNNALVNLVVSYATPYFIQMSLLGTNATMEYDGQTMIICGPRAAFDQQGRFIKPSVIEKIALPFEEDWQKSLEKSVTNFLEVVKVKRPFNLREFEQALRAMEPVFACKD